MKKSNEYLNQVKTNIMPIAIVGIAMVFLAIATVTAYFGFYFILALILQ